MDKLTSRKFWIAVAAFLASLGTSIAGFATQHEVVAWVGIICTTLSAAIYAASEAYVDGAAASAKTTRIEATTNSSSVVEQALNTTKPIVETPTDEEK